MKAGKVYISTKGGEIHYYLLCRKCGEWGWEKDLQEEACMFCRMEAERGDAKS